MKALITIELDYPEQIYDLYETKEIRLYDKDNVYSLWEGGFEIMPMPQKKEVEVNKIEDIMHVEYSIDDIYTKKYVADIRLATDKLISLGYNACIDEIAGDEE